MRRFSSISTTQLARICGVSQGTVDRALHDRGGISQKTKEKILAVAREYEYVPHTAVGNSKQSMLIGVVLFDLYNEFFSKLAMSLVNAARADGYSVVFLFSNKSLKEEKSAIDYFNYIGVDGIVLFSVGSDSEEYENYLKSLSRTLVTVGNRLFDLDFIGIDDYSAMYDLTEKVLSVTGGGEIQYFAPILKKEIHRKNAQRKRAEGFIAAMNKHGAKYSFAYSEQEISQNASGIICSTDHYAMNVLEAVGNSGIAVAGFDNVSALKNIGREVFTVDYSTDEIAKECMNYFLRRKYNSKIKYSVL